jgi:hypothetical protein
MLGHLVAIVASVGASAFGSATHGIDAYAPARSSAPRAELRTPWCGDALTSDDTAHQVANGPARYHAILAVPSDAPVRLAQVAPQIQADALEASALLERRYGKAIRYDLGTRCGSEYLDISVLRMRVSAGALAAAAQQPGKTLQTVYDELAAAGWPVTMPTENDPPARDTDYVVWLDGESPPGACGQATLYDDARRIPTNRNNLGGSVAMVFRDGDGFCNADAVRHEIGHTLGAVQPSAAPHGDPSGHCGDAFEDTMCLDSSPTHGDSHFQGDYFDYGNDDYWDPPNGPALAWWTADLSRFLCQEAGCNGVTSMDTRAATSGAPVARAAAKKPKAKAKPKKKTRKKKRRVRSTAKHASQRSRSVAHRRGVKRGRRPAQHARPRTVS